LAKRLQAMGQRNYVNGFRLTLQPHMLELPLKWKRPNRIFVNSMSDLFHQLVPTDYVRAVAAVMQAANWHTYQVLTKRSPRLRSLLDRELAHAARCNHIWWGVSVENRKYGLPRIDDLLATSAAVKFLSIEPLLEDLGRIPLDGINWVIVGGESGPGAREMKEEWVISIQEQCAERNVPFFFKQWGGVRKKMRGRLLQGKTFDEYPVQERRVSPDSNVRIALLNAIEDKPIDEFEAALESVTTAKMAAD